MEVICFKGTLAASLPDSWFQKPDTIKFSSRIREGRKTQVIDFRGSGGRIIELWTIPNGSQVACFWGDIHEEEAASLKWSDRPAYIEPYSVAKTFGHTSKRITIK
jgi:hypothetical protein